MSRCISHTFLLSVRRGEIRRWVESRERLIVQVTQSIKLAKKILQTRCMLKGGISGEMQAWSRVPRKNAQTYNSLVSLRAHTTYAPAAHRNSTASNHMFFDAVVFKEKLQFFDDTSYL